MSGSTTRAMASRRSSCCPTGKASSSRHDHGTRSGGVGGLSELAIYRPRKARELSPRHRKEVSSIPVHIEVNLSDVRVFAIHNHSGT